MRRRRDHASHRVVGITLALGCACQANEARLPPAKAQPARAAPVEPTTPSNAVARERAELDDTVWKNEVIAQRYEQTFVRLWDELRNSEDKLEILGGFAFSKLSHGEVGEPVALDHGIQRRELGGTSQVVDGGDWAELVRGFAKKGWKLVHSEWHHGKFEPSAEGPARSVVGVLLHVANPANERRVTIEGELRVEWGARDGDGHYVPDTIEVHTLTILERKGPPAFKRVKLLDPLPARAKNPAIQPILVFDLDGDGLSEVILAAANRAYWNKGNMKFSEREFLDSPTGQLSTATIADFDGDGHVDVLAAGPSGSPLLYRGDARGRFPKQAEVLDPQIKLMNPLAMTAGDIDGDGDIDVFITQYKRPYVLGQMPTPYYDANDGFPAHLLVGDGKGGFTDETQSAGLAAKRLRRTYSASFVDLDGDNDLDLLVVSDFSGVDLYQNDGRGKFTDVTERGIDERSTFGMSHTFGDYDLDGILDLFVVGMSSTTARRLELMHLGREEFARHQEMRMAMAYGNRLYRGAKKSIALEQAGSHDDVARTGWSWGTTSIDFDNDADLDLYVANGHISRKSAQDYCTTFWRHDIYTGSSETDEETHEHFLAEFQQAIDKGISWNGFEHNKLFMNAGGKAFVEIGFLMGVALEDDSRAVASDDLDGDGRPDLLVVTGEHYAGDVAGEAMRERAVILRNQWDPTGHFVGVRLAGSRSPIGAEIMVSAGGRKQVHRVVVGDSFQAQHAPAKHFGLGELTAVDSIKVRWPDGKRSTLENPAADQWHIVK